MLVDLDHQVRERQPVLPLSREPQKSWSGIGFSLNGFYYVSPIDEIAEILEIPRLTTVPGVHPWVKGLGNVRGRLVPVIDLMQFFYGRMSAVQLKRQRLFLIESNEHVAGVIVDEVLGMQHFLVDSFLPQVRVMDQHIRPFITGGYSVGEKKWPIFSPLLLFKNTEFMTLEAEERVFN